MQHTDFRELESQLERDILERYDLPHGPTTWQSHDTIGPDDMAHYFTRGHDHYVLVWDDFPSQTFIHEEHLSPVRIRKGSDEWLHIKSGELQGYYSLYHDTPPRVDLH